MFRLVYIADKSRKIKDFAECRIESILYDILHSILLLSVL